MLFFEAKIKKQQIVAAFFVGMFCFGAFLFIAIKAEAANVTYSANITLPDDNCVGGVCTYNNLTINNGVTVTVPSSVKLIVANGDAVINGTLSANGQGEVGGTGVSYQGTGRVGSGVGAGGAGLRGAGGAGHGGRGAKDSGCGAAGGITYDSESDPILVGSGGGSGGVWCATGSYNATTGAGGRGGGYLNLVVNGTLTIEGAISANGNNASGYTGSGINCDIGGSGGAIKIFADEIIGGSGRISAIGGTGSDGRKTGSGPAYYGGGGGGGRISLSYSISLAGRFASSGATGISLTAGANGCNSYLAQNGSYYSYQHQTPDLPDGFEGWAWIGNTSGNDVVLGLVSLYCGNIDQSYCNTSNYRLNIDKENIVEGRFLPVSGYAWAGNAGSVGWINFGASGDVPASSCPLPINFAGESTRAFYDLQKNQLTGWARIISLKEEGEKNGHHDWGWVSLCGENAASSSYKVFFDQALGGLSGFVWSGGGSVGDADDYSNDTGLGWIEFSPQLKPAPKSYIQTKDGDIYARGNVVGTPAFIYPEGQYGATFLILSSGTIEKFPSQGGEGWQIENYQEIDLLDELDADSLVECDPKMQSCNIDYKNKYGETVDPDFTSQLESGGNLSLNGEVKLVNGDLDLDNPITFLNGLGEAPGSGTIVVNGDLNINADITYQQGSVELAQNLASVAWIVRGNVNIASSVSDISGNFFLVGDTAGEFNTGSGSQNLVIRGLVAAKSFVFGRGASSGPSELVIYDARVVANPPPGLKDFSRLLPYFVD